MFNPYNLVLQMQRNQEVARVSTPGNRGLRFKSSYSKLVFLLQYTTNTLVHSVDTYL